MSSRRAFAVGLAALVLAACGPRQPLTTWGYSSWFEKGTGGSLGGFKRQQRRCLAAVGLDAPEAVAAESPEEKRFLRCMNAAGWCTHAWDCKKPA
jgi:hypothetical protein